MLRHLGFIAPVYACIVASVGCDGGTGPAPIPTVTVEVSGRVVNADTGDPVGNVNVQGPVRGSIAPDSATSGGDGTFTLRLNLQRSWSAVDVKLTGLGYEGRFWRVERNTAGIRAEIRIYPTLVIKPGESIEVRVDPTVDRCAFSGVPCRRVLVEASPGDPVELAIVPHDPSTPMGLTTDVSDEEAVLRLMVAPGSPVYVAWGGVWTDATTARGGRLNARR